MSTMLKQARRLLLSMAVVGALLSVGTATASAVPAYWTPAVNIKLAGSLTITNGTTTYSCPTIVMNAMTGGDMFMGAGTAFSCSRPGQSGLYSIPPYGTAHNNGGSYSLTFNSGVGLYNGLFPGMQGYSFNVPFTNASGANPSKIVFNNTLLGASTGGPQVRATGTLNITPLAGGGTVTLN